MNSRIFFSKYAVEIRYDRTFMGQSSLQSLYLAIFINNLMLERMSQLWLFLELICFFLELGLKLLTLLGFINGLTPNLCILLSQFFYLMSELYNLVFFLR